MHRHILLFFVVGILAISAGATIRRVGNPNPNPLVNLDYSTFYDAYQASSSNDTMLVWPDVDINIGWPGAIQAKCLLPKS